MVKVTDFEINYKKVFPALYLINIYLVLGDPMYLD